MSNVWRIFIWYLFDLTLIFQYVPGCVFVDGEKWMGTYKIFNVMPFSIHIVAALSWKSGKSQLARWREPQPPTTHCPPTLHHLTRDMNNLFLRIMQKAEDVLSMSALSAGCLHGVFRVSWKSGKVQLARWSLREAGLCRELSHLPTTALLYSTLCLGCL